MKARSGIALVLGAALLAPAAGHAAWSADPVTVHATTDHCPLVAAASDAQDGAIVVWQQDDAANPGVYRLLAKRVLANGDVDASWPASGLAVSSATVDRVALGAVGDGSGGAFVWWMEDALLYLTRLLSDGTIAPGWPARGRLTGSLYKSSFSDAVPCRPLVFADGQGGLWLGWLSGESLATLGRITHLGPDGLGVNGWPDEGRGYAASGSPAAGGLQTLAFTFAAARDGGAWIAWADAPHDLAGIHAGSYRLLRTDSTGLAAPGWSDSGRVVSTFHGELLPRDLEPSPYYGESPVAVASDGADGLYMLRSLVYVDSYYGPQSLPVLFHLDSTGTRFPGWPTGGVEPIASGFEWASDHGAECSLRLFPEAVGGVFALRPSYYTEGAIDLTLSRFTETGTQTAWSGAGPRGFECIVPPTGDTWLADYWPIGRQGPFTPTACLGLGQTYASGANGPGFSEWHDVMWGTWYGDIGLAPTSGTGAIFVWSQERERFGVFARRFAPGGQVTAVEPGVMPARALRLRFAAGRGVIATLGTVASGRIQLYDVTGRVCGGADVPAGVHEVTLEGSGSLASGLYFARHRGSDGAIETGRVVIVR